MARYSLLRVSFSAARSASRSGLLLSRRISGHRNSVHTSASLHAKYYLGNELPTPYGDDTARFKHLFNIGGNPFNWESPLPGHHLSSDEHLVETNCEGEDHHPSVSDLADAQALNEQLFARDFEGSPEENMTAAFGRLGLSKSQNNQIAGTFIEPLPYQIIGIDWMLQRELSASRGGILGDDMGLGKTIQAIGMILKNQAKEPGDRRPTLILVPKSLLQQWRHEIDKFSGGTLRILTYHGTDKHRYSPLMLAEADIVLSTISTVRREISSISSNRAVAERIKKLANGSTLAESIGSEWYNDLDLNPGSLHKTKWRRIIIDEAHDIRNRLGMGSRAVCHLDATYRWCLTGTPVFNTLADIYSLLRFLRVPPWDQDQWHIWKMFVQDEEKGNAIVATRKVRAMLKPLLLRRTKTSTVFGRSLTHLPEVHVVDLPVALTPQEESIYRNVEGTSQDMLLEAEENGEVFSLYECVLAQITRMKQCLVHYALIPWTSAMPDISGPDSEDFDRTFKPQPSSKVVKLRQLIADIPREDKIIVVSGFAKVLELVRPYLERAGFKTEIYTAKYSMKERLRALESFKTDESVKCLLMSSKAGGSGLNITEANHMIFLDLAWNPATEQQCLGRIHRIGQEKPVFCTRLIVENSIEDRMKTLQSDKQKMSDETLGIASGFRLDVKNMGIAQLKYLFGLTDFKRKPVKRNTADAKPQE